MILTLLVGVLYSSSLSQNALQLYKKLPFASKPQTVGILHQLESLYVESVINHDKEALKYSLKGLIRCKHLLGMDATTYEKEYAYYKFQEKKNHPTKSAIKTKETTKNKTIAKLDRSPVKSSDITVIKTKPSVKIPPFGAKEQKLYIKDIKLKNDDLVITFNHSVNSKDILFFELNQNKNFKDIYDIKAILPRVSKKLNIDGISRVAISQNSKEKVRLVLENNSNIDSSAYLKDNKLVIHITKKTTKITKIPTKTKPKKLDTKKLFQTQNYKRIKKYSKSIVIDAGHGGKDSGAVGYNRYQEKRIVLSVAKRLRNILKKKGYRVYMTRSSDKFVDLKDRTHFANLKQADLFISIHANAVEGKKKKLTHQGIETFYLSPARSDRAKRVAAKENRASLINLDTLSKNTLLNFLNREKILQSNKLAIDIQGYVLSSVRKKYKNISDGGVRPAPFWVLVGASMPSVLVEIGYITNPTEANRLVNPFYQEAIAKGLADGIESYFLKN